MAPCSPFVSHPCRLPTRSTDGPICNTPRFPPWIGRAAGFGPWGWIGRSIFRRPPPPFAVRHRLSLATRATQQQAAASVVIPAAAN